MKHVRWLSSMQTRDRRDCYGVSALLGIGLLALFMDGYPFGCVWIYDDNGFTK
jgi:hypothetical protein